MMFRPAGYDDSEEDEFDEYGYISDFKPKKINWMTEIQQTTTEDYDALLYDAIMDDNLDETKRVLQLAGDLRAGACLRQGWPALFYACYETKFAIVQYLLAAGIDVQRSYNLQTALMVACSSPKPTEQVYSIVRLLLENGAIVGVLDRYGWSPLMFACKEGHLEVVKEIIGESSLLSVDNEGNTALFHAVKNNRLEIVKVLLRAGAPTNIVNREGFTPRQCAVTANYMDIADLLPAEEDCYELPAKYMTYKNYRDFIHGETEQDHPEYSPEIGIMLFGMHSENNIRFVAQANMNLFELLTVTDERLQEIGIKYPIERKRILLGLYDFHRQPWSKNSLWTSSNSDALDCYDVQESLGNMLRQLTVIHGSVLYTKSLTSGYDPEVFAKVLQKSKLLGKLEELRTSIGLLQNQLTEIHKLSSPKPVLHITKQDTKHSISYKALSIGACVFVGSIAICIRLRYKLQS
ncbi:ankyrin repeat, SAM and basic leucine zipper domain-containing protein 1 [Anopheles ziemanni]|uniref:ankyrin repeat, SAM and basic leucine zipper domain-containing protein 1 n=1 Tax=Anopheles coustani TaxID=139045 RepID=UPI0026590FD7|nr:ankyrin repeat, SAM and basic leucine zipper domain-containing protein 1 [Anopheles coustani]XP_058169984.1 ankyrin repeat, SAM and basic leucine zipper domain-containing protein 1 [Anopheles ziemanni]